MLNESVKSASDDQLLAKMLEQQSDLFRLWGEDEIAADLLDRSNNLKSERQLTDAAI